MFSWSLHSGTGGRELHHGHYLAVHSTKVPYIHLGPYYPYPGSTFSWLKRWGDEAGWAFKPSLGKNLQPNANLLKSFSNLKGSKKREGNSSWLRNPGAGVPASPTLPYSSLMVIISWSSGLLVQVIPTSSLDLQSLDHKIPVRHISPSHYLLLQCSDPRECWAEPGGMWAQWRGPCNCSLSSGTPGGFHRAGRSSELLLCSDSAPGSSR